jgi:hypothetical protein
MPDVVKCLAEVQRDDDDIWVGNRFATVLRRNIIAAEGEP